MGLVDKLSASLFGGSARSRTQTFLDGAMAASALVATADGDVSFAQLSRLDQILASVDPLKGHDVHAATDLFRGFVEKINSEPEQGRKEALKAVEDVKDDQEEARLLVRISCAMARAKGAYTRPGTAQIREIARALGQTETEMADGPAPTAANGLDQPYCITVGNHKGGTGKSTTAVHLAVGLMRQKYRVGCIDLDGKQGTLSHYLSNRHESLQSTERSLPLPDFHRIEPATGRDREVAEAKETERLEEALDALAECDFVILDTPGSDGHLTDLGHAHADTLITPLNDSFLDIDVLARIDRDRRVVLGPSAYAKMVMEQNEWRIANGHDPIDWMVMRNRLAQLDARNTRDMSRLLEQLADRMGFRLEPGLSERVVYRELFFSGLTLLDLPNGMDEARANPSRWNARKEVHDLLTVAVDRCAAGEERRPSLKL